MNLVQINERLKDLPMQVIQQYANGMNPEVPPYLALGELQRREISQKQAATAQGGAQGPQPSVKEQMEQKAGLMQAQQLQQQQMAQQMQQPRGPMPAPAGIPQPEAQPEMAMAGGGLTSIPLRRDMFDYAEGGIIAFAGGGGVEEKYRRESEEMGAGKRMQYSPDVQEFARSQEQESRSGYAERERQKMLGQSREIAPQEPAAEPNVTEETMRRVGPMTAPKFADPRLAQAATPTGLPEALQKPAPSPVPPRVPPAAGALPSGQAVPPAAGAPAGLPAAAGASPFIAEAAEQARKAPTAPTPAGIIAEQSALAPASMQEAAMKKRVDEQRARAGEERAAYEKTRPSGLDELIRVFGQAGQYKGLSGTGPAYTAMQQQKRAEDLGMERRQNELLTAIEGREYEGGKELFGARTKAMDVANKAYQDRLTSNTKTLADLAGVDQRRMDEVAQRLTQMEVAKLQAATAARPSEAERIEARYMKLKASGNTKEAEEYLNTISTIKGSGTAGVGATRNAIQEKRLQLTSWKDIRDNAESEVERKEANQKILQITRDIGKLESGDGGKTGEVDKTNPLLK
jgi:hypothetical protein